MGTEVAALWTDLQHQDPSVTLTLVGTEQKISHNNNLVVVTIIVPVILVHVEYLTFSFIELNQGL